ncbi:hypothetical protein SMSP2_00778 [Limihaloglobus sulfuriphilus]|uniref:Cytochrome b561 bacterial/Ni-hydrogenase domain-containing protein n=1 Tax=Limihaloglobus sulfuriphilus TaxID=1851148 RepID=A0A1Q2MCN1_9BACT|nr:hypothetical protein [Limihaloglobus sulfuriphilus]AQQ70430.1 hypothetical protein SMSP2_00778 [Limihaloglobus sulfuriphilus]
MFKIVFIISFIAVAALIAAHFLYLSLIRKQRLSVNGFKKLVFIKGSFRSALPGILNLLISLAALGCLVLLALSGFWNPLIKGENISGWLMMAHVPISGAFAVIFVLFALFNAQRMKLNPPLEKYLGRKVEIKCDNYCSRCILRSTFWILVILFVPLVLSILLGMFKIFGTQWQRILMTAHKYTALAFMLFSIIFIYGIMIPDKDKK